MNPKKIHNVLGLLLLLPLIAWIGTGVVFLIKPGYAGAYQQITAKQYAIEDSLAITPVTKSLWQEVRFFKTVLGNHLLVKIDGQWQQLNPKTLKPLPPPSEEQVRLLLADAISNTPERYGNLTEREGDIYKTSTGVDLTLDWNTLGITQKGNDTKLIGTLYKIHYLQWLGHKQANTVFGVLGLVALALLVFYGVISYVQRRKMQS